MFLRKITSKHYLPVYYFLSITCDDLHRPQSTSTSRYLSWACCPAPRHLPRCAVKCWDPLSTPHDIGQCPTYCLENILHSQWTGRHPLSTEDVLTFQAQGRMDPPHPLPQWMAQGYLDWQILSEQKSLKSIRLKNKQTNQLSRHYYPVYDRNGFKAYIWFIPATEPALGKE